ncbi:MAG: aminotransferase class IV [Saccharofermentanales bacterium]
MAHTILEGNIGMGVVYNHRYEMLTGTLGNLLDNLPAGPRFYEVIRCIEGIPLFVEDHLGRLAASAAGVLELPQTEIGLLALDIARLIREAGIINGNVRIVIGPGTAVLFPSSFHYPDPGVYATGVNLGLLRWDRQNPNIKAVIADYKNAVAGKLASAGPHGSYFETLLYSEGGAVSEGSRSNAFFVAGGKVVTAPDHAVLKGVTRRYVLDAISAAGLETVFDQIHIGDIETIYKSAFISGTSIGVLPAAFIEDTALDSPSDPSVIRIREAYEATVSQYIRRKKSQAETLY